MDELNNWAGQNTSGVIKSLLSEPLASETKLTLANALYFYGTWVKAFDKEYTAKAEFNNLDGSISQVDMMRYSENKITYAQSNNLSATYLPFGNGAYEMVFILPDEDSNLDTALSTLTTEIIDNLNNNNKNYNIPLFIPRFEISGDVSFKETLKAIGLGEIFSNTADFSRINPDSKLFVGDILQNSFIKVDEEGAEGAAATLTLACTSAGPGEKPHTFTFDRPFIFLISEKSSGAILFAGGVKNL